MPVDPNDFLIPESEVSRNGNEAGAPSVAPEDAGLLARLWVKTPKSGGPRGGRDQSLTDIAGALRRRRFSLDEALVYCSAWNSACCEPPIDEPDIRAKLSRFWVEWLEGSDPLLTPEAARGEAAELQFLTMPEMAALETELGAMKWLLDNVLPEGGLVYFSAPPAGAKTWALLDMVKAFVTGEQWLGKYDLEPRNVLYLDEEMGVRKALPRLRKLGVPDDAEGFWYTDKAGVRFDNPKHVAQIVKHCEANSIRVVFVDTLTRVHSLDENDNSQMRTLFRQFSTLMDRGITVIVAHHDRKKGAESDVRHERMRGAGEIAAMADMAYSIDKVGHMFRLTTSKGRLVAEEDQVTVDFSIVDSADKTGVALREVTHAEKEANRVGDMERRIREALMDGPCWVNELVTATRGRKSDVSQAARGMADRGELETRKDGQRVYYGIPGTMAGGSDD